MQLEDFNIDNIELKNHLSMVLDIYDTFDGAHKKEHALKVLDMSLRLADKYEAINKEILIAASIYHDIGLMLGRSSHHNNSAKIVSNSLALKEFFNEEEIELIALACKEHRASSDKEPSNIYSKIIADADNLSRLEIVSMLNECMLFYNLDGTEEEIFEEIYKHISNKYGENGYAKYFLNESLEVGNVCGIKEIIGNKDLCKKTFAVLYNSKVINDAKNN